MFLQFLSILAAVTLSIAVSSQDLRAKWQEFKKEYGKNYASADEEAKRFKIFSENSQFIEKHNKNYANGKASHALGMNQFGDLTQEEFINSISCFEPMEGGSEEDTDMANVPEGPLPHEVDWRKKGYVTPVKTQHSCGSCWAFSATGSLEGQHFRSAGILVSLSEQNLVDCMHHNGCKGGDYNSAFKYIQKNSGIDTEESYPYRASYGKCQFKKDGVGATVTGFVRIKKGSEVEMKRAVGTVGPVSITINASLPTFRFHKHDVYDDPKCSGHKLNHAVLVVGYGMKNGKKYWIVKNSWGPKWGDKGYILMSRDKDNQCGVATYPSYPLV